MHKINIKDVIKGSIAWDLDIQKGDKLITLNGKEIIDIIDYRYEVSNEFIQLEIEKATGERYIFEVEKDYDEDLGLVFEEEIIDKPKHCRNKCIFCFIDQLPKGVRKSLLFKDDDYRFSFLQGNFITMTNMSEEEIARVIKYKLSPIYVSIHATDDDVRVKMINNPNAKGIMDKLKKLCKNGIEVHGQIVLCPEINDGKILDKTIKDLSSLYPGVKSIAVVPVGLTDHRERLYKLRTFTKEEAKNVVEQVSSWQKKLKKELGSSFVFLSDEFYVMAGVTIPSYYYYEGFPQIENGVGLMALFKHQFEKSLKRLKANKGKNINTTPYLIVTGIDAYNFMEEVAKELRKTGFNVKVEKIHNEFFGHNITVAGLVVGRDIINQLKGKVNGEVLVIPDVMLRESSNVFLDDMTVEEVEKELGAQIMVSPVDGKEFLQKIQSGR